MTVKTTPPCEEVLGLFDGKAINCGKPSTQIIRFTNEGPYRMCNECSWHSVKNRGATVIGDINPVVNTQTGANK